MNKEGKSAPLHFKDLIDANNLAPIDLDMSVRELRKVLGSEKVDYIKLINIDVPKLQVEIKQAIRGQKYDFAARKLSYMLSFNGDYKQSYGPGYRENTKLVMELRARIANDEKLAREERASTQIKQLVDRINKESASKREHVDPERNVPFKKHESARVMKKNEIIEALLNRIVYGFALIKYKDEDFAKESQKSLGKYVGVKLEHTTVQITPATFSNYVYVGSSMFASLRPHECVELLKRMMEGKTRLFVYDLSVPDSKCNYPALPPATSVDLNGVIEIRYRTFEEALYAYDAFLESVSSFM